MFFSVSDRGVYHRYVSVKFRMIYVKRNRLLMRKLGGIHLKRINNPTARQPAGAFDTRNFNYGINEVAC